MAETNSNAVVDDDKQIDQSGPVTEEDLRKLKYPDGDVETSQEEDEPPKDDKNEDLEETPTDDEQIVDEDKEEETPAFVKEFDYIKGDTPEEYAKNLEAAYKNSSSEALRLKTELETVQQAPPVTRDEEAPIGEDKPAKTVTDLYVQQQLDNDIKTAFDVIKKDYPQASDPTEYAKFTDEVAIFANASIAKGSLAAPIDLYNKAAISLGWEKNTQPDDKEKLGQVLKDGTTAATSAPSKPKPPQPKLSEAQLKLNRKMYPGKTDQEIYDELKEYL